MRRFIVVILVVVVASVVSFSLPPKMHFSDQFDGATLDSSSWNYNYGDGCPDLCGWGNQEQQIYTDRNVSVSDGQLRILATRKDGVYYSGKITTKDKVEFQYGTVEVRAKLPVGRGVWPAIWMLGHDIEDKKWPACGEIDIMEYAGKNQGTIHTSIHTSSSYGITVNTKVSKLEGIEEGFHTYKTQWSPNSIKFSIDNELVYTFSPKTKNETNWPFNKPFYLILNLAIGGHFGGHDIDDSIFPAEFLVDYVKVYKN